VNLIGSFVLGLYLARWERAVSRSGSLRFWAIGVLGSFTTFSAFSVDVVRLLDAGRLAAGGAYVAVSLIGGLVCAVAGLRVGAVVG
jgi:CrcB protein